VAFSFREGRFNFHASSKDEAELGPCLYCIVLVQRTLWKHSTSSQSPLRPMPAFSIRKSTSPTFSRKLRHSSTLLTSAVYVSVSPASAFFAAERRGVLMSTRASFMPCDLQRCATASPMPEAPPVIRAVAPARKTGWVDIDACGEWGGLCVWEGCCGRFCGWWG